MTTPEARQSSLASNLKHTAIMIEATETVPRLRDEIKPTPTQESRFWAKINKDGPTLPHMDTPCWVWTASKIRFGYGHLRLNGKIHLAHRVAWTLANGPIPHDGSHHGICVLHRCDNPACCRVDHLFLGTNTDNARDKTAKGRNNAPRGDKHPSRLYPERLPRGDRNGSRKHPERLARGEAQGSAKLTAANVIEIRARYAAGGVTFKILGTQFGVNLGNIHSIVHRKIWKHVP